MENSELLEKITVVYKQVALINAGVGVLFLVLLVVAAWQWSAIHFIAALIVWLIFIMIRVVAALQFMLAINIKQIESDVSKGIE